MALQKITTDLISANTIATGNIADNSVDATKIAQNSILTRHIDDDQVTGDHIANNAILTQHIDDDQVTGDQLADAITVATSVTTPLVVASTSARVTQATLAQASGGVTWNALTQANAFFVPSDNNTVTAPSNAVEGAIIQVEIAMGSSVYAIAWNTVFEFAASTTPVVTATANKTDIFTFRYNGSVWQEIGRVQNLAQT